MTHRDQTRVRSALFPIFMGLTFSDEPQAVKDCTLLNRAFMQGPDPLFLMETCPIHFAALCRDLDLTLEQGREAIEIAHVAGPGALLDGQGLTNDKDACQLSLKMRQEALWIIMASVSHTEEADYKPEVSIQERLVAVATAAIRLAEIVEEHCGYSFSAYLIQYALGVMLEWLETTTFTENAQGIPVTNNDIGFYLGYKLGHRVVGVQNGDKVFYGTIPGTTLAAEGITVETQVSPSYGFNRIGV